MWRLRAGLSRVVKEAKLDTVRPLRLDRQTESIAALNIARIAVFAVKIPQEAD